MRYLLARFVLMPLVRRDYRLRDQGLRPDRWHWADKLMVRLGYAFTYDTRELVRIGR